MAKREIKSLFCERFDCPPAEYEDRAFRQCLYWHARLLTPVVRKLSPRFFAEDMKFIQELGLTSDWRAARSEVLSFQAENQSNSGFWRNSLRIRVSGRKAAELAQRLFSTERRKNPQPSPA
jgi:hypothetical protein